MKKLRNTPAKRIAAAPTLAEKRVIALRLLYHPKSAIGLLVYANAIKDKPACDANQEDDSKEKLKQWFSDLMFPALWNEDPKPFRQLVAEMRKVRNELARLDRISKMDKLALQKHFDPPDWDALSRLDKGLRLRFLLLDLRPDDLLDIRTVQEALEKEGVATDDSTVRETMKELGLSHLQPGQAFSWTHGAEVVRTLRILPDGTSEVKGLSLKKVKALGTFRVHPILYPIQG